MQSEEIEMRLAAEEFSESEFSQYHFFSHSDEQVIRRAKRSDREIARVDLEDGEVVGLIDSDQTRGVSRAIPHRDRDASRAGDDVRVGDDRSIGADYEPRTQARSRTLPGTPAKELLEHVGGNSLHDLRLNRDDRGSDPGHRVSDCRSAGRVDRRRRRLDLSRLR